MISNQLFFIFLTSGSKKCGKIDGNATESVPQTHSSFWTQTKVIQTCNIWPDSEDKRNAIANEACAHNVFSTPIFGQCSNIFRKGNFCFVFFFVFLARVCHKFVLSMFIGMVHFKIQSMGFEWNGTASRWHTYTNRILRSGYCTTCFYSISRVASVRLHTMRTVQSKQQKCTLVSRVYLNKRKWVTSPVISWP